jgi:SAM-dependent methyltransferase
MRWLAKAALQQGIGALPHAESVNYVFQRRVSRTLPAGEDVFRRKFGRALGHLGAYVEHGPRRDLAEATFYEFGAGWDLAIPLSYWALGLDRQVIVDIRPNLRPELVNLTLERLRRLGPELGAEAARRLRDPPGAQIRSAADLEEAFGIHYLAPRDARATDLDAESVDFVTSTNTLEHIPADDLVPILRECHRLLRPDGGLSSRIDLCDHYSYSDRRLSPYNFLRFSDRTWRLLDSKLAHQNRLRRPDFLDAFEEAGLSVVSEQSSRASETAVEGLRELGLAPRFRSYALDELAVTGMVLVALPASASSPDAAEELDDLVGRGGARVHLRADAVGRGGGDEG